MPLKVISLLLAFATFSQASYAECRDIDSIAAADKTAQEYVSGKTFKKAIVLKRHLPSKRKEVASYVYVKSTDLYYTIYSLVSTDCKSVKVLKQTKGKH